MTPTDLTFLGFPIRLDDSMPRYAVDLVNPNGQRIRVTLESAASVDARLTPPAEGTADGSAHRFVSTAQSPHPHCRRCHVPQGSPEADWLNGRCKGATFDALDKEVWRLDEHLAVEVHARVQAESALTALRGALRTLLTEHLDTCVWWRTHGETACDCGRGLNATVIAAALASAGAETPAQDKP
jgi:hypothetical protein